MVWRIQFDVMFQKALHTHSFTLSHLYPTWQFSAKIIRKWIKSNLNVVEDTLNCLRSWRLSDGAQTCPRGNVSWAEAAETSNIRWMLWALDENMHLGYAKNTVVGIRWIITIMSRRSLNWDWVHLSTWCEIICVAGFRQRLHYGELASTGYYQ